MRTLLARLRRFLRGLACPADGLTPAACPDPFAGSLWVESGGVTVALYARDAGGLLVLRVEMTAEEARDFAQLVDEASARAFTARYYVRSAQLSPSSN